MFYAERGGFVGKKEKLLIISAIGSMLVGCSSGGNVLDETTVGSTQEATQTEEVTREFFQFEDDTGDNGKVIVDYNETDMKKIDALELPWGEPLPYFELSEKMYTDFFGFPFAYECEEFPATANRWAVGGKNWEPEKTYDIQFDPIGTDFPIRLYIMAIIDSGSAEITFEDDGKVVWESGVFTENTQFFVEFDELHMERPVLYVHLKQDGEEQNFGVWDFFFLHREFIEELERKTDSSAEETE